MINFSFLSLSLGIIKSITIMTLYMNSIWWPPNTLGAFLNQSVFLILSALTVVNFVMASIVGPGLLPLRWKPKVSFHTKCTEFVLACLNNYLCGCLALRCFTFPPTIIKSLLLYILTHL